MIRKSAQLPTTDAPLMNGNGNTIMHVIAKKTPEEDLFGGSGRLFGHATLKKGCSVGYHQHKNEFEIYYILSGTAMYNDNGKMVELSPGDMAYCAPGEWHAIENQKDEDLVYICLINNYF